MAREGFAAWKRDQPGVLAFDTETTGLDFYDEPFCVTVAWRSPAGHVESHYVELDTDDNREYVHAMLEHSPVLVGHNLKFDIQKVLLVGLAERERLCGNELEDTEALAHLLDEHRRKGLKYLAHKLLGEDTDEEEAVKAAKVKIKKEQGFASESEIGYHLLPREIIVPYALKDAEFTLRLWEVLRPQLAAHDDLASLYALEMELSLVLLDMERAGFSVDLDYAQDQTRAYGRKIIETEQRIEQLVSRPIGKNVKKGEFNPNSPQQIVAWFDEEVGITLLSTDKTHLAKVEHPLAEALLELRHVTKLHGTYFLPILKETRNGVIHPNFRQHGTVTGRMSSGGAQA